MVKIGKYDLLSSFNLIIPENETATVDASFDQWSLYINVEFMKNIDNKNYAKSEIDIRGNGTDSATLIFRDWINPLGTAMTEPGYLGTSRVNRVDLYFMAAHWLVGTTNRLDLQLMTKASK